MAKKEKEEKSTSKKEDKKVDGTKIVKCSCIHPYQDSVYGLGRRVANRGKTKAICTVCGKVHGDY